MSVTLIHFYIEMVAMRVYIEEMISSHHDTAGCKSVQDREKGGGAGGGGGGGGWRGGIRAITRQQYSQHLHGIFCSQYLIFLFCSCLWVILP